MKILAIGDCNTSGMENADENIPIKIAAILENQNEIQAQVTNLGYTMSTSREGVNRAKSYNGRADVLLLNFGLVDAWTTSLPALYVSYFPDNPMKGILRKLLKSMKKRLRHPLLKSVVPMGRVVPEAEYRENMTRIIETIKGRSPDVRIILWGSVPTYSDPARDKDLRRYDDILMDIARKYQADYVPTRTFLEGHAPADIYYDAVHLSAAGQDIIAQEIAKTILKDSYGT